MTKMFIAFILFCTLSQSARCQDRYVNRFFGFSINTPKNWIRQDEKKTVKNLENFDFSQQQLDKVMELHQGSIPLLAVLAKDPKEVNGIIPTMKIGVRYSGTTGSAKLRDNLKASLQSTLSAFPDFQFIDPGTIVNVAGQEAVHFVFSCKMPANDSSYLVRSSMYAFLRKGYFIQFSFSDAEPNNANDELYESLMKSLVFTK